MMDAADALEQGAELIAQRGLAKGVYEDLDGRLCFLGALREALVMDVPHRVSWEMQGTTAYVDAHGAAAKYLGTAASKWNDEPGRTAEEVVDVMKLVAKDLRNQA